MVRARRKSLSAPGSLFSSRGAASSLLRTKTKVLGSLLSMQRKWTVTFVRLDIDGMETEEDSLQARIRTSESILPALQKWLVNQQRRAKDFVFVYKSEVLGPV